MAAIRSVVALGAALALLAAGASSTRAAFQSIELSLASAPVGTAVTMHIEISGRASDANPSDLYLMDAATWGGIDQSTHCADVPGAIVVGTLAWTAAPVEYDGVAYPGFVSETTFTVPDVPLGRYYLAERIVSEGTGCHVFTTFEVAAQLPDTAIARPAGPPLLPAVLLAMVGIGLAGAGRRLPVKESAAR